MRMHNHDFKEQQWTNFASSYKKDFGKHEIEGNESMGNKVERNNEGNNAIVLGNHKIAMVSSSKADYTEKRIMKDDFAKKQSLQQTSALVLGNNNSV